jgi:hypothetical protein
MADAPYKPVAWAVGKATAQIGDDAKLVYGESTSVVVGWQFGFNVGGSFSVFVDPFVCFPGLFRTPLWGGTFGLIYNNFMGRTQYYLSNKTEYILGRTCATKLAGDDNWNPGNAAPAVRTMFSLLGLAITAGTITTGFAADKVVAAAQEYWQKKEWTIPVTLILPVALVIRVVVKYILAARAAERARYEAEVQQIIVRLTAAYGAIAAYIPAETMRELAESIAKLG